MLLLDSNQQQRERTASLLRGAGLRVIALDLVEVGPPLYKVLQPDAAIICSPPDGRWQLEAARKLRQLSRGSLPIFVVLDPPAEDLRCRWLEKTGAADVLLRPVDGTELIAKVRSWVQIKRAVQRAAREENERAAGLAEPITGAFTRSLMLALIDAETRRAERYGGSFAVVTCGIDGFEQYHQAFGRGWADRALKHAVRLLRHAIRGCDLVSRIGESQFALFLPGTGSEGLSALRKRLITSFQRSPLEFEGRWMKMPLSVGIASFPEVVGPAKLILRAAFEDLRRSRGDNASLHHTPPIRRPDDRPSIKAAECSQA